MDIFESKLNEIFPDVDWSQDLLSQLSSISVVTLIVEIEKYFKVEIHPMEVSPDNFASLSAMNSFIEKKKNGRR